MVTVHKYHGLGNDFLLLEWKEPTFPSSEWFLKITDRNRGIGADGVLLLSPAEYQGERAVKMVIFNRDGSRPEMCGNGVRCVAAFAMRTWDYPTEFVVLSDGGPKQCAVVAESDTLFQVGVDMGPAVLGEVVKYSALGGEKELEVRKVDLGNPHGVIFESHPLDVIDAVGKEANDGHELFPEGVNLEFVTPAESGFHVVVYERGVGRTKACGTGACAVAAAAWKDERSSRESTPIELPGGVLTITPFEDGLWMEGPAEFLFTTVWDR